MTEIENAGNHLRTLRLGKGLSTKDVTQATRISETNINAIEDQDFSSLPADTFTRGLLTIYAEFLGADPEAVVEKFMEERQESPTAKKLPKTKSSGRIFAPKRMAEPTQLSSMTTATILLVIIIVSFAGYCYYTSWNPFSFLVKQNGEIQAVMDSVFPENKPTAAPSSPDRPEDTITSLPLDPESAQPVMPDEPAPAGNPNPQQQTEDAGEDELAMPSTKTEEQSIQKTTADGQFYSVSLRFIKNTSVDIKQDGNGTVTRYFTSGETYSWPDISSLTLTFSEADSAEIIVNEEPVAFPSPTDGKLSLQIPLD